MTAVRSLFSTSLQLTQEVAIHDLSTLFLFVGRGIEVITRASPPQMFYKMGALKKFALFTRKPLQLC